MKYLSTRKASVVVAGALLSLGVSLAHADDAGMHDFFLSGATAGSTQNQAAPAEDATTSTAPAQHATVKKPHYAARTQRHVASRPALTRTARHEPSKDAMRHLHAHFRNLKDEKTRSSS